MELHYCIDLLELWRFLLSLCVVFGGSLILLLYLFLLTLICCTVVSHQKKNEVLIFFSDKVLYFAFLSFFVGKQAVFSFVSYGLSLFFLFFCGALGWLILVEKLAVWLVRAHGCLWVYQMLLRWVWMQNLLPFALIIYTIVLLLLFFSFFLFIGNKK